jgi:hypothetical protein
VVAPKSKLLASGSTNKLFDDEAAGLTDLEKETPENFPTFMDGRTADCDLTPAPD